MSQKIGDTHANQFQLDPRQLKCWAYYTNPTSETFGNAYRSGLRAGYEDSYSRTLNDTEWFIEKLRRLNMLSKSEKVLDFTLDIERENADIKLAQDTAKFIAKTQGKNMGYSERQEITGAEGEPITILISKEIAEKNALDNRTSDNS